MKELPGKVLEVIMSDVFVKGLKDYISKSAQRFQMHLSKGHYDKVKLLDLDTRYKNMNMAHRKMHTKNIESIDSRAKNVLEIACGTGWNIPIFKEKGLNYFGADISDTAIAVAMSKYPLENYFNISVKNLWMIADSSFDVVYNSSMLEHIDGYEAAICEMVRIAKHEAIICFFEGLTDSEENQIKFHPYPKEYYSGKIDDLFGAKIVLQHDPPGWYWNRYSFAKVKTVLEKIGYPFEHYHSGNVDYLPKESVIRIKKN